MSNLISKSRKQSSQGKQSAKISKVISRGSLAHFTASRLLIDQPRSRFGNLRFSDVLVICLALPLLISPNKTSAAQRAVALTPAHALVDGISARNAAPLSTRVSGFDLSAWIGTQKGISVDRMMTNISRPDVKPGVVIASPEKITPNYFFHWIRDSALVMDVVVRSPLATLQPDRRNHMMTEFIEFSRENQLSRALTGLGEPKFNVDGTPFDGPWGRPQNDGPALRALTLTHYTNELLDAGDRAYVEKWLYNKSYPANTVIKTDLEYVSNVWREDNFDLWEETRGDHFYTRMVQLASLREGAKLAVRLDDDGAAMHYIRQAEMISGELSKHWDEQRGFINATIDRTDGPPRIKSGLDVAVILGVLHAGFTAGDYTVMDPRVMATALKVEEAFKSLYAINAEGRFPGAGTAIGRYPEDVYSGSLDSNQGHAWFLNTAAMAELNYKIASNLNQSERFLVGRENVAFIRNILQGALADKEIQEGTEFTRESGELAILVRQLVEKGDGYMRRIRFHVGPGGSMAEQFDRDHGFMRSAGDLTWSYAAFITSASARPATLRP